MKEQPKTVGFQLDPGHHRRLEERARRYNMSPGQYARDLIINALDSQEDGILQGLNIIAEKVNGAATTEDVSKLRSNVSTDMKEIARVLGLLVQEVKKG